MDLSTYLLLTSGEAGGSSGTGVYQPMISRPNQHTFTDPSTGAPVRVVGLSAFQALDLFATGRVAELEAWLSLWQGYAGGTLNWLRVFRNKPAAQNNAGQQFPGWEAPFARVLPEFCAFAREHGLHVEIVLLTQIESDLSWARAWVDVLGPIDNAWVEGCNEPDGRKNPPSQLEQYGVLSLPRYSSGDYDPAAPWKGTYFTLHPDRRPDLYDAASQAKTAVEVYAGGWDTSAGRFNGCHCACLCDEPGKFEDYGNDEKAIRQFYQGASLMSAGATVHTINSQFCWPPTANDARFAPVAFRALSTFPPHTAGLPYSHNTADEAQTGAINTYQMGAYGCRFGGALRAPEVFGPGL